MSSGITPYVYNTLPATLVAHGLYFISDPIEANKMEIYLADMTGTTARRIPTNADIQAEIANALAAENNIDYQVDYTAMQSATYATNSLVYVQDATADPTVDSGAALYFYNKAQDTFYKAAEFESMDLVINWATLQDKPVSPVADIDDAVNKRHTHANLSSLDQLTVNGDGDLVVGTTVINGKIALGSAAEW